MFLLVTTKAAVADADETNIATTPAMIALFMVPPLDLIGSSPGVRRGRRRWRRGRRRRWWRRRLRVRAQQTEDVPEQRPWDRVDVDDDLVQIGDQPEQVEVNRTEDEMEHVALDNLRRCLGSVRRGTAARRAHRARTAARAPVGGVDDRLEAHDRAAAHARGQRLRSDPRFALGGDNPAALGEIAEQLSEN